MQTKVLKVVHYENQFFGRVGGEDKAYQRPQVRSGPIGPGRAVQEALGERGRVVATVICGDNYFVERMENVTEEVVQMIISCRPDIVIVGPAFASGRYGIACGAVSKAIQELGIPTVTGMHKENPGVDLYKKDIYIVETADSARGMAEATSKMVNVACKLAAGQKIGKPSSEGLLPRGLIINEAVEQTAAERVVSMLLSKLRGHPFQSEVPAPRYDRVKPAPKIEDIRSSTIALVTDGGLVPKGNPDKITSRRTTHFGAYSFKGETTLGQDFEVVHIGYDSAFVVREPNRLVPVDVMRDLERERRIGKLHETFYSTSGGVSIIEHAQKMGQTLAEKLKTEGVSGVILTSA